MIAIVAMPVHRPGILMTRMQYARRDVVIEGRHVAPFVESPPTDG